MIRYDLHNWDRKPWTAKAMLMLSTIDAAAMERGVTVPTRDYVEGIIGEFDGYMPAAMEFIWGY